MRLQFDSVSAGNTSTRTGDVTGTASLNGTSSQGNRPGSGPSGGDSIQISGPSAALNQLSADRAGRIQQLTSLVQSGSYQVSGSLISRAIVDNAIS